MTVVKHWWHVDDIAAVMALYDVQKVFRCPTGDSGPWTEITSETTRVPLRANVKDYLFDDAAGDVSYYYAAAYYNSTSGLESPKGIPERGEPAGYASILDVRNEGFTAARFPDERVQDALDLAAQTIDQFTGQWFEPRARTVELDVRTPDKAMFLDIPIIAATKISVLGDEQSLADFLVYNRHLTQGLTNPDDRYNPRIEWDNNSDARFLDIYPDVRFYEGQKSVKVEGVWGFTELFSSDPVGETTPGSQIPLSYGRVPPAIKRAALLLVAQYLPTIKKGSRFADRGRVTQEKTKDQSISYGARPDFDNAYGMTGDTEVDAILMRYRCPYRVGTV